MEISPVQRFKTLQPDQGKNGGNVDQDKYEAIRDAFVQTLEVEVEISYTNLAAKGLGKMK